MNISTDSTIDTQPLLLNVSNITLTINAEQYYALNADNQDLRLGVRLGLLVDVWDKQVEIYRTRQEPEILKSPTSIDCSEVMSGFVLRMDRIFG